MITCFTHFFIPQAPRNIYGYWIEIGHVTIRSPLQFKSRDQFQINHHNSVEYYKYNFTTTETKSAIWFSSYLQFPKHIE